MLSGFRMPFTSECCLPAFVKLLTLMLNSYQMFLGNFQTSGQESKYLKLLKLHHKGAVLLWMCDTFTKGEVVITAELTHPNSALNQLYHKQLQFPCGQTCNCNKMK